MNYKWAGGWLQEINDSRYSSFHKEKSTGVQIPECLQQTGLDKKMLWKESALSLQRLQSLNICGTMLRMFWVCLWVSFYAVICRGRSLRVADKNNSFRRPPHGAESSACGCRDEDVVKTSLHHGRLPSPSQCSVRQRSTFRQMCQCFCYYFHCQKTKVPTPALNYA